MAVNLCTLAEVRALLQKKSTDTSQDALIEELIPRASETICGRCDRQFAPEGQATHYFDWPWENELVSFAPWDLQELVGEKALTEATEKLRELEALQHEWERTSGKAGRNVSAAELTAAEEAYTLAEAKLETSIVADTDQKKPYFLSSDEFRLWPYNKRDGVYQSVRVRPFGAAVGRIVWKSRQLKVVGVWGFPTIPQDVVQATAATVVHWMTVNVAAFRRPDDPASANAIPRRGLPPEAWDLIQRYKRADSI